MSNHDIIQLLVQEINKYSFTNKNILSIMTNIPIPKISKKNKKKEKKITDTKKKKLPDDFFIPQETDNLFWCWYIYKFGLGEYTIKKKYHFTIEKENKINFVSKIRETKFTKNIKIKKNQIESNLTNDKILTIKSLETMLYVEKINFIYMNDKIYYEPIYEEEFPSNKKCIIKYFKQHDKYCLFLENQNKLVDYKKNLFIVDSITKPIKNISKYKVAELRDICQKLNIPNIMKTPTKYKTKKELYQLLCEKKI